MVIWLLDGWALSSAIANAKQKWHCFAVNFASKIPTKKNANLNIHNYAHKYLDNVVETFWIFYEHMEGE